MLVNLDSSPFGSAARTRSLKVLRLLGESYPREIARLSGISLSAIQKALQSLERDGLAAARSTGRMRLYRLDPRFFAARELDAFLRRLAEADSELQKKVTALRRRPRRSGKPLP